MDFLTQHWIPIAIIVGILVIGIIIITVVNGGDISWLTDLFTGGGGDGGGGGDDGGDGGGDN